MEELLQDAERILVWHFEVRTSTSLCLEIDSGGDTSYRKEGRVSGQALQQTFRNSGWSFGGIWK
jgi:hypothetical protein